jgi:hypothetical protein
MSKKIPSHLETQFANIWQQQYPQLSLIAEHAPARPRRYRIDFADPSRKIGIEVQGGIWQNLGGHSGGAGVTGDIEKFCFLAAIGWRIFPLASKHLVPGNPYLQLIANAIEYSPICTGTTDAQLMAIIGWDSIDRIVACQSSCKTIDFRHIQKYWRFDKVDRLWHPVDM